MIVAVTGGRHWQPTPASRGVAMGALADNCTTLVRHGGCTGLDTWFDALAVSLGIRIQVWLPHESWRERWREMNGVRIVIRPRGWGDPPWPGAGPKRNWAMLNGQSAYWQIANVLFKYKGHKGTASCTDMARRSTIPVRRME